MSHQVHHDPLTGACGWAGSFRSARFALVLAGVGMSLPATGCRQSDIVPVAGRVTFEGQPVPQAVVRFLQDARPMAAGGTDADGRYRLTTRQPGDGGFIGQCKVMVAPWVPAIGDASEAPAEPVRPDIPKVFRDAATTPLSVEVKRGVKNTFDFELSSAQGKSK